MQRRSRTARRSGRPIRGMDWGGQTFSGTIPAGSQFAGFYVLLPSTVRSDYVDPTIMALRTVFIGRLAAEPAGGGAIALGIIPWDDVNDTVPVFPDTPGPISNPNLDWMQRIVYPYTQFTPPGTQFSLNLDRQYESKARRRLGNTKGLLAVIEIFPAGVALNYAFDTRFLLKE